MEISIGILEKVIGARWTGGKLRSCPQNTNELMVLSTATQEQNNMTSPDDHLNLWDWITNSSDATSCRIMSSGRYPRKFKDAFAYCLLELC